MSLVFMLACLQDSSLYILSDCYNSKKYVSYKKKKNFQSKSKTLLNYTYFKEYANQTFVATVLVTYVTLLTEHDLSLQN